MGTERLRSFEQAPAPAAPQHARTPLSAAPARHPIAVARGAGNRAFARLIARERSLQRVGGWSGASASENQSETTQSGYRRIPVSGLPTVDKALVLIPPGLSSGASVDVLVHLHGQNQGYLGSPPRDLDAVKDRFEEQLKAAGRPQLVAVLPQGSSSSADYGEFSKLKPRAYAEAALKAVAALDVAAGAGGLSAAPSVKNVILSGHSGGGFAIKAILDDPAQRSDLGGLVWFDAVQAESGPKEDRKSTGQREMAKKLIAERIDAELTAAGTGTGTATALASGFQFRLYADAGGYYAGAAKEVEAFIEGLFGEKGSSPPAGQSALAGRIAALDQPSRDALRRRYQVILVTHADAKTHPHDAEIAAGQMNTLGHENMIGSGALADALTNMGYGAAPAPPATTTVPPVSSGAPALARQVLSRSEDIPARLIDTAAARGRSGTTPEEGKSLLTSDYIRATLAARDSDAKVKRQFDYHVQLLQGTDEGPQRDKRYESEAGLLIVELENDFIHDPAKSAVDLLPPDRAKHFRELKWGVDDYPGGEPGPLEGEATAMMQELRVIRPERRPNAGGTAVITEAERDANLKNLQAHLKAVDDQPGHMLFDEAADQFSYMAAIAALDGVELKILSSWRDPAVAKANAAKANNPAAVAAFSSHSLGLAVDLKMSGGSQHFAETATHPMGNVFAMRSSEVHKWMVFRGAWFGWFPYGNEPWHWEYNPAGFRDRYRAAVMPVKAPAATAATGA